jgi:[protein-PII] uridylyltransferase
VSQESSNVQRFRDSMPKKYRQRFHAEAIIAHAHISELRGDKLAIVRAFPWQDASVWALCVVADDRPGLLATISASLVMSELDVVDAEAYTRQGPKRAEAVDIFWVRPLGTPELPALDAERVERLNLVINGLLEGRLALEAQALAQQARPSRGETTVRFVEGDDGNVTTLEVETEDRSGLLLSLSRALFHQKVQITGSEVRTREGHVQDRFHILELDGSPISEHRRLDIQVAVLTAIDPPLAD